MEWAKHTCWDNPEWDGTMSGDCDGCVEAAKHPCMWCGYGHVFPTHNPLAHLENGDPLALQMGEDNWGDMFANRPYVEAS